jgi:hypothetical protein
MSDCPREQEALELVRAGRWPDGCDDETRAHVATCVDCGGSVQVASLLAHEYHAALRSVRVPASGLVWWRAQRRAREEAQRTAARVVTVVQGASVAIGVAAALAIAGTDGVSRAFALVPKGLLSLASLSQWSVPLLLGLTVWLALAPVALYLAVSRD